MDSKYILGIDELDSQHEGIETICVALQEAVEDRDRRHNLLKELCERLRFHFYTEESIMDIFSYPESQEHRKAHLDILKSFESYKDVNLTDADIKKLREQPMQAILEQIHSQDVRFAAHIKRNKERLGIS